MRSALLIGLLCGLAFGAIVLAWAAGIKALKSYRVPVERVCPPYYECNGPAATRHPACCPET